MSSSTISLPDGYDQVLAELKNRVRTAQRRTYHAVHNELIALYWSIGRTIIQQNTALWGAKVVTRLAEDLRVAFPNTTGFSRRNLNYMRAFATAWPGFVPQAVAQIAWGHVRVLLDRLDNDDDREWYAAESSQNGWSRAVLEHQIVNHLRPRLGAAPANFQTQLSPADATHAQNLVKDPFVFDFLGFSSGVAEREALPDTKQLAQALSPLLNTESQSNGTVSSEFNKTTRSD